MQLAFSKVTAPFDGVVTRRNFFESRLYPFGKRRRQHAAPRRSNEPTRCGSSCEFPTATCRSRGPAMTRPCRSTHFPTGSLRKVSRIASHEDPTTRLMHVEIDPANPTGEISAGMYGQVTIRLDKATAGLSIPLTCVIDRADSRATSCSSFGTVMPGEFVQLGRRQRSGASRVVNGLSAGDRVLVAPSSVTDDQAVTATTDAPNGTAPPN